MSDIAKSDDFQGIHPQRIRFGASVTLTALGESAAQELYPWYRTRT